MRLLLASKSPRRRELLARLGYPIGIVNLTVEEHVDPTLPAAEVAEHLARRKAAACDTDLHDSVLVTADTVVVLDGKVLGKPSSRQNAIDMLSSLSGKTHTVYTGVCLRTSTRTVSFSEHTQVHFLPLTREVIEHYVDNYRPYDKAGAYGIQEWIGMVGIAGIEGCFYNVMGLPLAHLYRELTTTLGMPQP